MFKDLKTPILLIASCLLTGCFQIEGVHILHRFGETDTGAYRITMNRLTYAALNSDNKYSGMLDQLRKWSRPTTRIDGDSVHLEDTSGKASMEHFYDRYNCKAAPLSGSRDCTFALNIPKELGSMPNWSIDWEVVLQPDMKVIASNHQRTRREDGLDRLIWYFDGNRVSQASVDFTVRIPSPQ